MSYALRRVEDGQFLGRFSVYVRDIKNARLFSTEQAARSYLRPDEYIVRVHTR